MQREITRHLLAWKDNPRRKPLLVTGVRQCGKTYAIEKFAKEHFTSYVKVNFEESTAVGSIFEYDFDVHRILKEIEFTTRQRIVPGETLLFFDEIQECPRAITSLKYFCENLRDLHVICAGSLLEVAIKREEVSFPVGKVNRLSLYPMSFKEFVIASGRENLISLFGSWPVDRPIPELYSIPMQRLLQEYYAVGGMPEAVQAWVDTSDFNEVASIQNEILKDYADDFSKHAPVRELPKIRWIWDSVPVQLAKENNKFVFSHVRQGKRAAELEDALQWLVDAGLITQVFLVENPEVPLQGSADKTYFKVYMSDPGLLRAKAGVPMEAIRGDVDAFTRYKGAIAESYVLNELRSLGKEPFFWRSGNTAEVDFVYEERGMVVPVEVKAADNTRAKSYRQFCQRHNPPVGFKFSKKNIAENMCEHTRTYSIPLYLVWTHDSYL